MLRRSVGFLVFFIFLVSFAGCATARKQEGLEIQSLKNQISVLEAQIQNQNDEIGSLRDALAKAETKEIDSPKGIHKKKAVGETKSRPSVRQIQTALEKAGYNPGVIDGRMGRQTREAIKAFQSANNLIVDGKVGKRTWELLKGYLYKKVK